MSRIRIVLFAKDARRGRRDCEESGRGERRGVSVLNSLSVLNPLFRSQIHSARFQDRKGCFRTVEVRRKEIKREEAERRLLGP